ncbi:uncharacterized protein LOC121792127 isoform X1 [Salvia splendens]|uniref:uncharacterized protein LOC121792127 isoform X1 n=1 Tax=Salvia splendens TaxID=180675 RepID=UPI001C2661BF|nr:uncharacterized protein LOC121792127 isoform X1 [Salvia splendens]
MLPRYHHPPLLFFTFFHIFLLSPSISSTPSVPLSTRSKAQASKMGKQSKAKKQEHVGKGKVTPVQIAFIVDRYLSDNNYIQTRSNFRSEASYLIAKSPVQEAPKSLLSLGAILDEYITLKEQKVLVDQERLRLEHEKFRVHNLLSGMQEAMNAYNSTGSNVITPPPPLPPPSASVAMTSQAEFAVGRPAGYYPMNNTPAMMSTTRPLNSRKVSTHLSTPITNQVPTKRKEIKDVSDGAGVSKRTRRSSTQSKDASIVTQSNNAAKNQETTVINSSAQSFACDNANNGSQVQGTHVVKCLFNQESSSTRAHSPVPKTPPLASPSQTEKSRSPLEISTATSSKDVTPQQIISANRTIISSETIRVSPNKQISYYSIERNHVTCSPIKSNLKRSNVKDHVKGRLDFGSSEMPMIMENQTVDGNSTSESEKEGDTLDLDFSSLDTLGLDFNLSDFLLDFDIGGDLASSSRQELASSPDTYSGSPLTSGNIEMGTTQITSEYSSTMAGLIGDTNVNLAAGADSVSAMRSVTKCITIVSPVKNQRMNSAQSNYLIGHDRHQ